MFYPPNLILYIHRVFTTVRIENVTYTLVYLVYLVYIFFDKGLSLSLDLKV